MEQFKNILLTNKNLILTGAPGTGKTYLAKELAADLIFGLKKPQNYIEELSRNEQFDFVQFHPSYDYTDFVEGLRPVDNGNGNIAFQREDGVFMSFCRRAAQAYDQATDKAATPKYVFVIDEINRGELSKIFGELFFSIDPGYRGKKGAVKTQYYNLWKNSADAACRSFNGSQYFYIPKNVFIIGTMNDIDRSIESMDFAMRRRFAFKEVKASDFTFMISNDEVLKPLAIDIEPRMQNLNRCILNIEGLNASYQIGGAYFLKLRGYLNEGKLTNDSWTSLWENHIEGLLNEYLRGLPNAEESMKVLKKAFDMEEKF